MSHDFRRVLCCVGLKSDCDPVLTQAVKLAITTGAKLDVLHAIRTLSSDVINTLRDSIPDQEILDNLAEHRLNEARASLNEQIKSFWLQHPDLRKSFADRTMTQSVLEGYPASVITQFAQKAGSDMIVLAANKRGFSATYAGKITKGVIKRAHIPVVVVPAAP